MTDCVGIRVTKWIWSRDGHVAGASVRLAECK